MTICVIPARGGSKGIPRKNVQVVAGKPLLTWSIEQAFAASSVDAVVVSTDCDLIAEVALDAGAMVFRRSADTATDAASSESALIEVLEAYPHRLTVFLQATSPIRQPGDIDRCVELVESYCDSLFSYRAVEGYIWTEGNGRLWPGYSVREMRQTWGSRVLEENGSIYVFRSAQFMEEQNRLFGHVKGYPMHPLDSFQVDELADLELMETLIPLRLSNVSYHARKNR